MDEAMESITFTTEEGEKVDFFVLEQTCIAGMNYLLVAESDDEESEALILREAKGGSSEEEVVYEIVEDEKELEAISKVFVEMMEDVSITM